MKIRQQTVECGFGDIKHNKGFRGFLTRGINQVRTEWTLVCAAANLIKINNLLHPPPKKTQKTYQIKKKNRNILDLILFQTQKGLKLT